MARNGSGSYSNPYPNFVSGTVISSAQVDANNSDIATALTQSIAVDGQSTVTGNIPLSTNKLTGVGAGSAATDSLNLGQAQAEAMHWCGTAGGSANAITLSPSPAITAYAAGQRFVWKASGSANTGATTVAISGLGTIALQDNGAALVAGNHAAGKVYMGILDTTSTVQVMQVQISGTDPLLVSSLTVSGDALIGDDLTLNSDAAILGFGENTDVTMTHVHDTGLLLNSTRQLQFGDSGTYIHQSADGVLDLVSDTEIEINATTIDINGAVALDGAITGATNITLSGELDAATLDISGNADIDGTTNLDAVDIDGATQIDATVTVGVDGTGYDVQFFGATSGSHMLWDESADDLKLVGAAGLTVAGNIDVDGTTNLDAVDIDGAVQIDATLSVGVDDQGYDVKFFGDTASAYMLWDTSADDLILGGAARMGIGTTDLSIFNAVGGVVALAVVGDSSSTNIAGNTAAAMAIVNKDGTASNTAGLHFARADTDESPNYAGASIVAQFGETQATGQYPSASLSFLTSTAQNSAPSVKMAITAAGRIGIGTVSPVANLGLVGGTSNATNLSTAYSTAAFNITPKSTSGYSLAFGSGPSDFPYIQMSAGGSSAHAMTINPYGGNVGVGNVSPASLLQVGPINATETLNVVAASGGASMIMRSTGGTLGTLGSTNNVPVAFLANNGEKMRLLADGKFVIGAATATDNLQVTGSGRQAIGISSTSTGAAVLEMVSSGSTEAISYGTDLRFASISGLGDAGFSEKMRLLAGGTLVIGAATANATASLIELRTAANTALNFYMFKASQVEMSMGFKASTDTNFYIGTGTTAVGTNGVYLANTGTSWVSNSDFRKKKNLSPIENALDKIANCRAVTGHFKHEADDVKKRPFLIAQDWVTALPEAVDEDTVDDDGVENLGLSYEGTVPLLVAAIKELREQNIALTSRITALEG